MKKGLSVLLLVLVLTGCSGGEKTTTICKGNLDALTVNTATIDAEGDDTKKMVNKVVYDFTDYVTDEQPMSVLQELIESQNPDYNALDGVTAKYSIDGNKLNLDVSIDFDKADLKKLSDAKLLVADSDSKDIKYISLEQTIKQLEGNGLTCKKQ